MNTYLSVTSEINQKLIENTCKTCSKEGLGAFTALPIEITLFILTRLPLADIGRTGKTSRYFHKLTAKVIRLINLTHNLKALQKLNDLTGHRCLPQPEGYNILDCIALGMRRLWFSKEGRIVALNNCNIKWVDETRSCPFILSATRTAKIRSLLDSKIIPLSIQISLHNDRTLLIEPDSYAELNKMQSQLKSLTMCVNRINKQITLFNQKTSTKEARSFWKLKNFDEYSAQLQESL